MRKTECGAGEGNSHKLHEAALARCGAGRFLRPLLCGWVEEVVAPQLLHHLLLLHHRAQNVQHLGNNNVPSSIIFAAVALAEKVHRVQSFTQVFKPVKQCYHDKVGITKPRAEKRHLDAKAIGIDLGEGGEGEGPAMQARAEAHRPLLRVHLSGVYMIQIPGIIDSPDGHKPGAADWVSTRNKSIALPLLYSSCSCC